MKINSKIAVSESGFVFDSSTGDSYSLNPIGIEIIEMIKKGLPNDKIKSELMEKYDVSPTLLEKSCDEFIDTLKKLFIIEDE
jgi:PqqD family protein of HPr-rel-A system